MCLRSPLLVRYVHFNIVEPIRIKKVGQKKVRYIKTFALAIRKNLETILGQQTDD